MLNRILKSRTLRAALLLSIASSLTHAQAPAQEEAVMQTTPATANMVFNFIVLFDGVLDTYSEIYR